MFFRQTRQGWRQRAILRQEAARNRREERVRLRKTRVDEIKRRFQRFCRILAATATVVLGCCLAGFVYGAYSAGRQVDWARTTSLGSTSVEKPAPVAASSLPTSSAFSSATAHVGLLPNPALTPGEADLIVNVDEIGVRKMSLKRHVSEATRECAWSAYAVPTSERVAYRLDHLIPIELGGLSDSCRNLWPQRIEDAARKDRLEMALNTLVRHGRISLYEAQAAIAANWIAAYAKFVAKPAVEILAMSSRRPPRRDPARQPNLVHAAQYSSTAALTCGDGSTSKSDHRRGACSHHGGIR